MEIKLSTTAQEKTALGIPSSITKLETLKMSHSQEESSHVQHAYVCFQPHLWFFIKAVTGNCTFQVARGLQILGPDVFQIIFGWWVVRVMMLLTRIKRTVVPPPPPHFVLLARIMIMQQKQKVQRKQRVISKWSILQFRVPHFTAVFPKQSITALSRGVEEMMGVGCGGIGGCGEGKESSREHPNQPSEKRRKGGGEVAM